MLLYTMHNEHPAVGEVKPWWVVGMHHLKALFVGLDEGMFVWRDSGKIVRLPSHCVVRQVRIHIRYNSIVLTCSFSYGGSYMHIRAV